MNRSIVLLSALVLSGTLGVARADQLFVSMKGQIQGQFAGWYNPVAEIGDAAGLGLVEDLAWSVTSPRDAASGLPTGKRQHKPLTLRLRMSEALLLVANALVHNENLPTVEIRSYARDSEGVYTLRRTQSLINANISGISQYTVREQGELVTYVDVSLTYQKIGISDFEHGVTFEDDWETPVR